MVLEVISEVVEQESFLLPFLDVLNHPDVQVHHQGVDLPGLPVLPQPTGDVEQNGLEKKESKVKFREIVTGERNAEK